MPLLHGTEMPEAAGSRRSMARISVVLGLMLALVLILIRSLDRVETNDALAAGLAAFLN